MNDMRILIVEDDFLVGELLSMTLEDLGHEVCGIATSEAAAVAAATADRPDLMICDMTLETGTGPGAVATICRDGFVPHLFVSGNVSSVLAVVPDAIVVEKPFRKTDLVRAIDRALTQRPS